SSRTRNGPPLGGGPSFVTDEIPLRWGTTDALCGPVLLRPVAARDHTGSELRVQLAARHGFPDAGVGAELGGEDQRDAECPLAREDHRPVVAHELMDRL